MKIAAALPENEPLTRNEYDWLSALAVVIRERGLSEDEALHLVGLTLRRYRNRPVRLMDLTFQMEGGKDGLTMLANIVAGTQK